METLGNANMVGVKRSTNRTGITSTIKLQHFQLAPTQNTSNSYRFRLAFLAGGGNVSKYQKQYNLPHPPRPCKRLSASSAGGCRWRHCRPITTLQNKIPCAILPPTRPRTCKSAYPRAAPVDAASHVYPARATASGQCRLVSLLVSCWSAAYQWASLTLWSRAACGDVSRGSIVRAAFSSDARRPVGYAPTRRAAAPRGVKKRECCTILLLLRHRPPHGVPFCHKKEIAELIHF